MNICIIGAGISAISIAREINQKKIFGLVTAFLDDDVTKIDQNIDGIPVFGPIIDFIEACDENSFDEFLIAIPSLSRKKITKIYDLLKKNNVKSIKIIPNISSVVEYKPHIIQARSLTLEDMLLRESIEISLKESLFMLKDKRVLVTGAGGSIGSEIARQLLYAGVNRLYILGHGENSIYEIERELKILQNGGVGVKTNIVPIIAELMDKDHIDFLLGKLKTDIIFHTAAYKHVLMSEQNPVQTIKNNVFGTFNLYNSSIKHKVAKFILISTDKVVKPECVYGVSKAICEDLILSSERGAENSFLIVRFGNVFGSRGSVIPLFQKQIESGGPVTITDSQMKRYFISIPEAVSLVLKTSSIGEDGGLYVLEMGDKIYIKDIAEKMIAFYGYSSSDIKIEYIGKKEGEKNEEELYDADLEELHKTKYKNINRVKSFKKRFSSSDIEVFLKELEKVCFLSFSNADAYNNKDLLRSILKKRYNTLK